MKKILLVAAVLLLAVPSFAQNLFTSDASILNRSDLRYKDLKAYYDKTDYSQLSSPQYSLGLPWLNLLLPGIGQYCMKEPGLGTTFLLLGLATSAVTTTGYVIGSAGLASGLGGAVSEEQAMGLNQTGIVLIVAGGIGAVAVTVSSIINAYSVAKVKSLYAEDLKNSGKGYSFSVAPTMQLAMTPNGYVPAPGVSLNVKF